MVEAHEMFVKSETLFREIGESMAWDSLTTSQLEWLVSLLGNIENNAHNLTEEVQRVLANRAIAER